MKRLRFGSSLFAVVCGCASLAPAASSSPASGQADAGEWAPYEETLFDHVRIASDGSQPNFQRAHAEVDFRGLQFSSATLVVDLATTCYPFENWQTDPPPSGQNFPADCDAFDRNFEISFDQPQKPDDPPAVEVMRAITPFGGPEHQEIDITDFANGRPGKHRIDVVIPTYSDGSGQVSGSAGGWDVTVKLRATPGAPPRNVLAVIPLVDESRHLGDPAAATTFTVPRGARSTRLEYRVTGHGGATDHSPACIGPAEEFCRRTHHLSLDGHELDAFVPWRTDCASLCTLTHYGPASGGFDYCLQNPTGAIPSVKAARANWCPGSLTPPRAYDPALLHTPGSHTFSYAIDDEAAGGVWRVSAVLYVFGS